MRTTCSWMHFINSKPPEFTFCLAALRWVSLSPRHSCSKGNQCPVEPAACTHRLFSLSLNDKLFKLNLRIALIMLIFTRVEVMSCITGRY